MKKIYSEIFIKVKNWLLKKLFKNKNSWFTTFFTKKRWKPVFTIFCCKLTKAHFHNLFCKWLILIRFQDFFENKWKPVFMTFFQTNGNTFFAKERKAVFTICFFANEQNPNFTSPPPIFMTFNCKQTKTRYHELLNKLTKTRFQDFFVSKQAWNEFHTK